MLGSLLSVPPRHPDLPMTMRNLDPAQFQSLLAEGQAVLLDVRTPEELALAALPGALNIPLHDLAARLGELDPARPVAVLCHHGVRSEMAGRVLERNGFADVAHLVGGIDAWSRVIDPGLPRY